MKKYIIKKERPTVNTYSGTIIDFYLMKDGKPIFVIGYRPHEPQSRSKAALMLLSLRATNFKYSVHCSAKKPMSSTVAELYENRTKDGFILSDIMYDTDAKKRFSEKGKIDLTFQFEKEHHSEHYIYRFNDFKEYQKAETFLLPKSEHLIEDIHYKNKFAGSNLINKRLPSYFSNSRPNISHY